MINGGNGHPGLGLDPRYKRKELGDFRNKVGGGWKRGIRKTMLESGRS